MKEKENIFVFHIRWNYISFVNASYYIYTHGYATRENIASVVHSLKYNLILHTKQTNILYIFWLYQVVISKYNLFT
jgi:hypothetical protein